MKIKLLGTLKLSQAYVAGSIYEGDDVPEELQEIAEEHPLIEVISRSEKKAVKNEEEPEEKPKKVSKPKLKK